MSRTRRSCALSRFASLYLFNASLNDERMSDAQYLREQLSALMPHMDDEMKKRARATLKLDDETFLQVAADVHLGLQCMLANKAMQCPRAPVPNYFARNYLRPLNLIPPARAFRSWLTMQQWYDTT